MMRINFGNILVRLLVRIPFIYTQLTQSKLVENIQSLPQIWIGDSSRGDDILQNIFKFVGHKEVYLENPWVAEDAPYSWQEAVHSFEWLYDLRASNFPNNNFTAYNWLKQWLKENEEITQPIWRSDIVARRLSSWLCHYDNLMEQCEKKVRDDFHKSITQHINHLALTEGKDCAICSGRLTAMRGLIVGKLSTNDNIDDINIYVQKFCQILEDNVCLDGMVISRCLTTQVKFLKDAIMVQSALYKMQQDVPNVLNNSIKKMLSALKFFRYADGNMAHMAGWSGDEYLVQQMFKRYATKTVVPNVLEDSGFLRLTADKTVILFDCGNRPKLSDVDAGILSFELTHKKQRIFVNCGYGVSSDHPMYTPCKDSAAHNTITIDDRNAFSLNNNSRNAEVKLSIIEESGWQMLQGQHTGFVKICSSVLKRIIAVNDEGSEIRGQDKLEQVIGIHDVVSRFHLHPNVDVLGLKNGNETILRSGKQAWKFKASGANVTIEDSFYMDIDSAMRKTQQIVLTTKTIGQNIVIKWSLDYNS